MDSDAYAALTPNLCCAIVDVGGHAKLVGAIALGHDRGRSHRDQSPWKMRREIDPTAGGLQIGGDLSPFGETTLGAEGE